MIALVASVTAAQAQGLVPYYGPDGQVYYRRAPDAGYAAPGVPPNIIAPERPRDSPRPRTAPIPVAPLEPLSPEPAPSMPPAPTPIQTEPNPLIEWCKQQANAKAPLCRNVAAPRVQR